MFNQSVVSSAISARVASTHLAQAGLLVLTGSAPCCETPESTHSMMPYALAKAAVHHLAKSLKDPGPAGLPERACTICILPGTLDTPSNRENMPSADKSLWTPLADVASLIQGWIRNPDLRPASGSLIKISTEQSRTSIRVIES